MYKNVREVFNDHCSNLSIDTKLCDRIEQYLNSFITKSPEHAQFFGGDTIGDTVVKFVNSDRLKWFEEILRIDELDITPDLAELISPVHYLVASDPFSLSCVWLVHAIWKSTKIPETKKQKAMSDIIIVMNIRFLTSRMQRHWPYPCSKQTAEATLSSMSNKYAIKRLGSWLAVLRERGDDTTDMKHSIHKLTIEKMDVDIRNTGYSVGYMITDSQSRIKNMLKNIYNVQKNLQTTTITSSSSTFIESDGEEVLKDKEKSLETYKRYLEGIIADKHSFIKLDLISIIENSNKTMPAQMFRSTLSWISDTYGKGSEGKLEIDEIVAKLMNHLLSYLYLNRNTMKNKSDISGLLSKMKGVYTSSRTTEETLLEIRDDMEGIVRRATKVKSGSAIAATRTGVMLYIVLRAFTMKHYQG